MISIKQREQAILEYTKDQYRTTKQITELLTVDNSYTGKVLKQMVVDNKLEKIKVGNRCAYKAITTNN